MNRSTYSLIATLAVVLISVANTFLPTAQAQTETAPSGSGTQANPYIIASLDNLAWLQDFYAHYSYWGSYYKQTVDIDASPTSGWNSGKGFTPIGNGSIQFNGTYDGDGHTISGLYISLSAYEYVGLFGYIINGGTVKNLRLTGVQIAGETQVGGLVGYSEVGTIHNCSVTGSIVTSSSQFAGGLVGDAINSTVDSCYSTVTFTSTSGSEIGGFVGYNEGGTTITSCHSTGDISGSSGASYEGGFVGYNKGTVTDCYDSGSVNESSSSSYYVGGFVGDNFSGGSISSSYCTGNVEAYGTVGGFIGENLDLATIENCYCRGNITSSGGNQVGGFVGYYSESAANASIDKCYSTGSVSGSGSYIGGLVGVNGGIGSVGSSYWDVTTSGIGSDGSTTGSDGGTGESTAHMKNESTFSGWDFTSTWGISGGVNNGYPYLIHTGDHSLPVQATDFIATAGMNSVTLSWSTRSEVDNAGFNVLREDPGTSSFRLIASYTSDGSLRGLGTSSTGRAYDFTDDKVISGDTYLYKIQSVSTNGTTKDLSTLSITVDVPKTYTLYQNYPNPFNPSTAIRFDLNQTSTVTLDIYNVLGQRVMEQNYGTMNAGRYDEVVNLGAYASGVYFYKLVASGVEPTAVGSSAQSGDGQKFVSTKKLVLMK